MSNLSDAVGRIIFAIISSAACVTEQQQLSICHDVVSLILERLLQFVYN